MCLRLGGLSTYELSGQCLGEMSTQPKHLGVLPIYLYLSSCCAVTLLVNIGRDIQLVKNLAAVQLFLCRPLKSAHRVGHNVAVNIWYRTVCKIVLGQGFNVR